MIWTPSLLVLGLIQLLLLALWLVNGWHALRIGCFWERKSGAERQVRLEALAELMAVLLPFTMFLTICALFLTIFTADSLAPFLTGAMCAFGVFTFSGYGIAMLACKIFLAVGTGLWLILDRVDRLTSEQPLVRLKFFCIPFFSLVLLFDSLFFSVWLQQMQPDTLVSCCGDLFSSRSSFSLPQLLNRLENQWTVRIYVVLLVCQFVCGLVVLFVKRGIAFFSSFSLLLVPAHLLIITLYITQYAFESPVHRCPFCLLQEADALVFWLMYIGVWLSAVTGGGTGLFLLQSRLLAVSRSARESCARMTLATLVITMLLVAVMLAVVFSSNYQYGWGR
ncbi:MAG: hypothetical protein CSA20_05465 [Deltaproteobacteria bacterium]|nr:MAG: hypothetical protein CSB23_03365 [Deltaproteobacteria bacterium]PIE72916.1 MAG: hypothetical protein CSA20_05465 [Deltaproteobacteria bacterium]